MMTKLQHGFGRLQNKVFLLLKTTLQLCTTRCGFLASAESRWSGCSLGKATRSRILSNQVSNCSGRLGSTDFVWILNGKGACSQRAFSDGRFILGFWFLGVSGLRYARSGSGSITQEWCRINPVEEAGKETWPDLT